MAILALVFAFVFSPAAIVMGHVAKKQIRQTGEYGEGLATAGLWLGYIFTGIYVLICAFYVVHRDLRDRFEQRHHQLLTRRPARWITIHRAVRHGRLSGTPPRGRCCRRRPRASAR